MKSYRIAVVGATGAVGQEMIKCLDKSDINIETFIPMASSRSAGKTVNFRGQEHTVITAGAGAFRDVDIALFSAGGGASKVLAPIAAAEQAVVIDNSNAWRMDPEVPLVVPEVNPWAAKQHPKGIIANPNCSTIQMVVALKPLHNLFKIKRIVVSTYQSVSGTGMRAIDELKKQVKAYAVDFPMPEVQVYPYQIAFNCLPHIDVFEENGYTKEEMKMYYETRKIFEDPEILVNATAVRVPSLSCHGEAVNIETEKPLPSVQEIRRILANAPGVQVQDDPSRNLYPMPAYSAGTDAVYVGRIRKDITRENGLNLWIVADNLRKGAALNAVQIAELIIKNDWVKGV
jgi:aspartate-semialdehyde dehydrogenase